MILLIDNYDSFTFNLYQYLGELGAKVKVVRNDQVTVDEIKEMTPEAIIISPGPGRPEHAGICVEVIQKLAHQIPILGICLGHQAIGYAFGGKIIKAKNIMHGKVSELSYVPHSLFEHLTEPLVVMRYHSLVIEEKSIPEEIEVLAKSKDDQEIMAIKHRKYPLYGMQFHPESIGTEQGKRLLSNFLSLIREGQGTHEVLS